jgi:hypothetical protein
MRRAVPRPAPGAAPRVAVLSVFVRHRRWGEVEWGPRDPERPGAIMPRPFVLILPEHDPELVEALEEAFAGTIVVHEPPPHFGIEETKLIIDLITDGVQIAGAVGGATAALVKLRNWYKNRPKPKRARIMVLGDGASMELVDLTDEELKKLAEESRRDV